MTSTEIALVLAPEGFALLGLLFGFGWAHWLAVKEGKL